MDNQSGRDLLSDLPVGIIENILTHLPIRDAIGTSILSSKWRFRWATIPHLVFDEEGIVDSVEESIRKEDWFKTFVTLTLLRHEGPIHKFKILSFIDPCIETDQWLLTLSRKDIKVLVLVFCVSAPVLYFDVPSCLYSFRHLITLELEGCTFGPPPPTFKGFLCLKTLILKYSRMPSDTIQSFIAHCPVLENLECVSVACSELRISAPNLKYFYIVCPFQEIYLCAPLLANMFVMFSGVIIELPQPEPSVCNYTKLFGCFPNLESLTADLLFTKYLSMGIEYCHHPLVFHHLKIIKLCRVNYKDIDEILVVTRLIMDAANLRELQVTSFCYEVDESKVPHIQFWDSECLQNCTFKELKFIKVARFRGSFHEMKFIKFLLGSSPLLETMIVEPNNQCTDELNLVIELMSYCRASANAKILFRKKVDSPLCIDDQCYYCK